jgi:hypothetical protein
VAQTYKVLAQANPVATTPTDVYTVPAATTAVVSSIVVANRAGTARTFRISVRVAGAGADNKQYLAYDMTVPPNDSVFLQLGLTLGAADVVTAYVSVQDLAINVFGVENT